MKWKWHSLIVGLHKTGICYFCCAIMQTQGGKYDDLGIALNATYKLCTSSREGTKFPLWSKNVYKWNSKALTGINCR